MEIPMNEPAKPQETKSDEDTNNTACTSLDFLNQIINSSSAKKVEEPLKPAAAPKST